MHNNKNNIWSEIFSRSKIDFMPSEFLNSLDLSIISFAHNTFVSLYCYSPELKIIPYLMPEKSSKKSSKKLKSNNKKYLICLSSDILSDTNKSIDLFIRSLAFYLNISVNQIILAFKSNKNLNKNLNNNSNNIKLCEVNLMDYINNNNFKILNLSPDIKFIEEKFENTNYAYIRTLDISSVISDPLLKKQVFLDVLPLSDKKSNVA
jgi:hypothetical protein